MKKNLFLRVCAVLCVAVLTLGLASCGTEAPAEKSDVRIMALKGPTGMGLAGLMSENDAQTADENYTVTLASSPDEVTAQVIKGDFDIAAVPVNLAAVLYKKTEGAIEMAAINTLGVLHILENGNTVNSVADLKGKTLYATGQGSTPEYILRYVLEKNGIDPDKDLTIEWVTEHSELATKMIASEAAIGMLPEPNVTTVLSKNSSVRLALDMTAEWDKVADEKGSLVQGVIIVNKDFAENNKAVLDTFLKEYADSVEFVNSKPDEAAELIAQYGIVPAAAIAQKAIPNCNICCVTGEKMVAQANAMFDVLYNANPASVGGAMPGEEIYYKG